MSENDSNPGDLHLETGYLCLDFANTAEWHASEQPTESLQRYTDLVAWAQKMGVSSAASAEQLSRAAAQQPNEAAAVWSRAIQLRETIYRLFSATAAGRSPDAADIALLNRALPEALSRLRLARTEAGFMLQWVETERELDQMLWPIIRSAAELLTSEEVERVKECEDDRGCGYLFFDTSRNRSRRWCTMRGCGNRAKVKRYRQRHEET